ncbi:MAG: holo-ACP synthase [Eubacterium sp.]
MIIGIGNDMIEIERVKKACEKEAFLSRYYTTAEIELCRQSPRRAAGNFAVKEAVSKCFGTGFRGFAMREIEVLRDELGAPYVNLYGNAKNKATEMNIAKIYVSITNTDEYAVAMAVAEGDINA